MFKKGKVKRQVKKAIALTIAENIGYTGRKKSDVKRK